MKAAIRSQDREWGDDLAGEPRARLKEEGKELLWTPSVIIVSESCGIYHN